MEKYLIIEQGEYSDYGVSILKITDIQLSEEEILTLIKIDYYDKPNIAGVIEGNLTLRDTGCLSLTDLKLEAEDNINKLFCCYRNSKNQTVLDKLYTKDECFKIAIENYNSGVRYWQETIDKKYEQYVKAYEIYKKLT